MILLGALLAAGGSAAAGAAQTEAPRELRSDSRSAYVHRLTLYDDDGEAIDPEEDPARPYSPHATCGKCHAVARIRCGWHFNADTGDAEPGRIGEPWIFTDPLTATQLPTSARGWPGTYKPADVGLSRWQFVSAFGRHIPGGGLGDPDQEAIDASPESLRWGISGTLQIDCMFCHSADASHDPAEAARQIEKENLKWAPTAALGLAVIRGDARKVPDDWDPYSPPNPDFPEQAVPTVVYERSRFDGNDRVLFDITLRPPVERCYFCHTVPLVGPGSPRRWETDRDVHLTAGMVCTDCHRNDIGHMITRGDTAASPLSCEGCHLGVEGAADQWAALGGGYGAPRPLHRGLPPVHFERLTCTACHAGPWPREYPRRVQTSMAHGLGLASKERRDDDPPAIFEPILALGGDGKIGPHRMIWPAFWGRMQGEAVVPVSLSDARGAAAAALGERGQGDKQGPFAPLTSEQIARMISALAGAAAPAAEPVYVAGGYVHLRSGTGGVEVSPHPAAEPVLWPLAHDVRPAPQSLGSGGCTDCHGPEAPFRFGRVAAGTAAARPPPIESMYELQGISGAAARRWAASFRFRPVLKWGGLLCTVLLGALFALHGLHGLDRLLGRLRLRERWSALAVVVSFSVLAVTGVIGWLGEGRLGGGLLLVHMIGAPLFVVGLTVGTFTRAESNRLGRRIGPDVSDPGRRDGAPGPILPSRTAGEKAFFWVSVSLGFVAVGSILVAMLPAFGYAGQEALSDVHRCSSLALLALVMGHIGLWVIARRGR